jgi:hypothetical protein
VDESKLHVPRSRPGIVARTALVERLMESNAHSVLAVVAPAGYGKTTLLAQWSDRKQPRVAWISADYRDNDPAALLAYLALALHRVEPIEPRVLRSLASSGAGVSADVARLASSIGYMDEPVVIIVDNAEALTNRGSRDVIGELAVRLPPGSQLAIGSRQDVPVSVSAGASAAYLTVSETWPIEIRSEAIAVFFAIGCIAGAIGPAFYGALIGDGSSTTGLFIGYLVGAGIMIAGGLVEVFFGINAEGKSLEAITKPLTAVASDEAA